jgi:pimeloyl-ACP methyl ester carboxylesterase
MRSRPGISRSPLRHPPGSRPTLVVAAAESKFVSVGEADRYRRSLADCFQLVVVPGGHMVLWEAFEETADAIETFL